ncbi:MAG: diacylglycerol kinase family protein [Bacteroidia bacterium]
MLPDKTKSVKRSIKSFSYAWKGLKTAFITQSNFKFQIAIAFIAIVAALLFNFRIQEWIILIVVISMVLVTELINTTIEIITDHLFPDFHLTAGKIKDISAAAVLIAAITAVITGILLFLPKIISYSGFYNI